MQRRREILAVAVVKCVAPLRGCRENDPPFVEKRNSVGDEKGAVEIVRDDHSAQPERRCRSRISTLIF